MFSSSIISLKPTKFNSTSKTEKNFLLFENAINYLCSSSHSEELTLKEIFGLIDSTCDAFLKLNIDNSWFKSKTVVRPITYLICLYYIKIHCLNYKFSSNELTYENICNWLKLKLPDIKNFKLSKNYFKEVVIKDNDITFMGENYKSYPEIRIDKLFNLKSQNTITYTTKPIKLKLKEYYLNFDGRCQGASRYWLIKKFEANRLNKAKRTDLNYSLVKSLETLNNKLISLVSNIFIDTYQNSYSRNLGELNHIQDIISNNDSLGNLFLKFIKLINLNKPKHLHIEIKTIEHAMGLILAIKGNYLKISFYDPNNSRLYWNKYILESEISIELFESFIDQMTYFNEFKCKKLQIVSSCYIYEIIEEPKLINNSQSLDELSESEQQEVLLLSVLNGNYSTVEYLLKEKKCKVDFIVNNATPLVSATRNNDVNMVKLLKLYGADSDFLYQGKTIVDLAGDNAELRNALTI